MKRILFTMMLMVAALVTWAQRWNPVSNNSYSGESPVYLKITLNGNEVSPNDRLEVAAFMETDGSQKCRATATSFYRPTVQANLPEDVFLLNVKGDPQNDAGKTITFKAYYQGVVYKFTETAKWNGETIQPVPIELTLDALSGVIIPDEVMKLVEVSLPGTKDLGSMVSLAFGAENKPASEITGSSIDTDETEIFLQWDAANSAAFFTIDENGVITAVAETGEDDAWLGMNVMVRDLKVRTNMGYKETNYTSRSFGVRITKAKVPVTSISSDVNELTIYVGDNILSAITPHITVKPDDADDTSFIIYEPNSMMNQNYIATKSGQTTVTVEANSPASNEVSPVQINVTILDYINEITAVEPTATVEVGQNAIDAIKQVISWTPSGDFVDEELVFTPEDATLYNKKTGKAVKAGTTTVTVTAANHPATHIPTATVTLIVKEPEKPVTAIELGGKAITVYVGDDVKEALKDQVTYTPTDADEVYKDFTVEETANVSKGTAIKPGECDVHVYAMNGETQIASTKTVHVTVMALPDYINGPDELTVNVGDNVKDAIEAAITIGSTEWDRDATASQYIDKSFTLSTRSNTAYYDADYKATKVTTKPITVIITTNAMDVTGAPLTKTINLTIKKGVTSITAKTKTINAIIGDDVYGMIRELITVNPSDATNTNLILTPNKASADAFSDGIATKAGTWKIVVKSEDNPNATVTITVNVEEPVSLTFDPDLTTTVGKEVTLTLTKVTGGEVDPSKVKVTFSSESTTVPVIATPDETGLVWTIKSSMAGTFTFYVSYDGANQYSTEKKVQGTLTVSEEIAIDSGWDWITINALPAGSRSIVLYSNNNWIPEIQSGKNKVIEIRSQQALLYNDPNYGFFGDITELKPGDGMYKIKTEGSVVFKLGSSVSGISASDLPQTVKGYTWLGYPHQIDQPLTALADALASTAEDGDMILGKDNFAEFSGGKWVAADGFTFKAGKGYMYYTTGTGGKTINWGTPDLSAASKAYNDTYNAKPNRTRIWQYDNSAFADNMPIVAVLSGIDDLENYSIGAFVGGDCRGEGQIVEGKYMFINVAGTSGEVVTFKLYNKVDETFSDMDETLIYGGKVGSLKEPLELSGGTTGIRIINCEANSATARITVTNSAGSVVRTSVGKTVSLEGLPAGMYIITVSDGSTRFSKKIVK